MAILSLRPRAFRTRNRGRDAETDAARLETVRDAIAMALADARHERDGLQQRIDMHYARAASVFDSSGEYGERDERDEALIRSSEQNASNGLQRVAQLDAQIQKLTLLMAELDEANVPQSTDAGVA